MPCDLSDAKSLGQGNRDMWRGSTIAQEELSRDLARRAWLSKERPTPDPGAILCSAMGTAFQSTSWWLWGRGLLSVLVVKDSANMLTHPDLKGTVFSLKSHAAFRCLLFNADVSKLPSTSLEGHVCAAKRTLDPWQQVSSTPPDWITSSPHRPYDPPHWQDAQDPGEAAEHWCWRICQMEDACVRAVTFPYIWDHNWLSLPSANVRVTVAFPASVCPVLLPLADPSWKCMMMTERESDLWCLRIPLPELGIALSEDQVRGKQVETGRRWQ
uniref:uncharacterized protein LOC128929114 n=1 Tax=Callithrix jacchus TaxID=9483 RepID=UPI0023DD5E94|nr:uncharacterized protein LOC128929114 [Callithrix jacchus]